MSDLVGNSEDRFSRVAAHIGKYVLFVVFAVFGWMSKTWF